MKQKIYYFAITLLSFLLFQSTADAKMNMGTINLKVGESKKVYSEESTYYTVSGTWSQTGNAFSVSSKTQRSCVITGVKEGTSTLEWAGYSNTNYEEMYWTINVIGSDNGSNSGGSSGVPDTGYSDSWTSKGNYSIGWYDNNKSEYHISTAKDLAGISYLVNNGLADFKEKTVKLDADIDLTGKNWTTIGDGYNNDFLGSFDGQNHTISGIYIVSQHDKQTFYGFFSFLSNVSIKDIRLQGKVSIENSNPMQQGFDTYNYNGYSFIGGLVGFAHNVYFENCKVEMDVRCKRDHTVGYIVLGGIAGLSRVYNSSTVMMNHCSHIGSLYAGEWSGSSRSPIIGGLIGWSGLGNWPGIIEYCENISSEIYCSETVSSNNMMYLNVGGLVGEGYSELKYCRNIVDKMTIKNKCIDLLHFYIGGIGASKQTSINCYSIVKSYDISSVTYNKACWGGITAQLNSSSKSNFSNSDITKLCNINLQEGDNGSTSYTASQMKSSDFLDELNIYSQLNLGKKIWVTGNDGYPCIPSYWNSTLITSVILNQTALSLQPGQEETLTAVVEPDNATDKSVTWSSSNSSVATVSNTGKVSAISSGTAIITCVANDGSGSKASCEVTVTEPEPSAITLQADATVMRGQTITLVPVLTPSNAKTTLTWSTDDATIATVNANGVVTGIKKGQTFINVVTDNGKTAYCKLTVTAGLPTAVSIPTNATLLVGEYITLTPTLTPEDSKTTFEWKSDNETVVKVSANGVLTGVAEGLAIVTVTTANGLTSNACKVKVTPDTNGIIDIKADNDTTTPVYSVSGQRLAKPRKGLNIVGGKKILVK